MIQAQKLIENTKNWILKNYIIISIAIIILASLKWYFSGQQSTDNAYLNANIVRISSQVAGPIKTLYVENNQLVKKGQLLFEIDPQPFELALNHANIQLELTKNKVAAADAEIKSAEALLIQKEAEQQNSLKDLNRIKPLVMKKFLTPEAGDKAETTYNVMSAAVDVAKANLIKTKTARGKSGEENEQIAAATIAREQAKLNLAYTKIYAPDQGKISNFSLRCGKFAQIGEPLGALISDSEYWVDANFKETEIENIKIGQKAVIKVDMYPKLAFKGEVISVNGGTGTAFSLLPPQNATGNWVKVTQRIPVKIRILNSNPDFNLPIGSSANVTLFYR